MFTVSRAARRFDALANRSLSTDGLSFLEGLVLAAIFFEASRPIKPSELAKAFGTTRASISHIVSSLEGKGLLQRKIDPEDARAYLLALKPQGKKCALRVIRVFDRLQQSFEAEVGKKALGDAIHVVTAMETLANNFDVR